MFGSVFRFEIRYWLRQPMVYVFLFINALLVFGAISSDNVQIGQSFDNLNVNAPYTAQAMYGYMSLIMLLMVTAFVQSAALRDFSYQTEQIIFSTPLSKVSYLLGRFLGACLIALVPLLGVTLGVLIGPMMPWVDPERVGPVVWEAHIQGMLLFGIPNTFIIGVIVFGIAAVSRSTIASFVGALALLVGYSIAGAFLGNLDNEQMGNLLDPFALGTFQNLTKYWTVVDRNTLVLQPTGEMLVNRLLWTGVAAVLLVLFIRAFSFSVERRSLFRKKAPEVEPDEFEAVPSLHGALPVSALSFSSGTHWRQMWSQTRVDLKGIVKSTAFIIILLFGITNMGFALALSEGAYGLSQWPVTYQMINLVRGTMYLFTIVILTFYTGELVWKERVARVDEIYDALPHPIWVTALSKFLAMTGVLLAIQMLAVGFAVVAQASKGYFNFELGVYFWEMLVLDLLAMLFLAALSFLVHAAVNNKYLGYFMFIFLVILTTFIWGPLELDSVMLRYGQTPSYTYSDMNGFGPFVLGLIWFNLYWFLFAAILLAGTVLLWQRGKDTALSVRSFNARLRFRGSLRLATGFLAVTWLVTAGFVFYNTEVLNEYTRTKESERLTARYETDYKALYDGMHQPRVVDIRYEIDVYPGERDIGVRGEMLMVNRGDAPIDTLFLNTPSNLESSFEIENASLVREDEDLNVQFYAFEPAMQPGDTLTFRYSSEYVSEGFENQLSFTQFVPNGSFFNNGLVSPQIGYQPGNEMSDRNERRKMELPERDPMPTLDRDCTTACMDNYISNFSDWVTMETVISTSADQIAIAPGSLQEEWEEDGRRYFRYELDTPSLGFASFISADYQVDREEWVQPNGDVVDLEVYYHAPHTYNTDKMMNSLRKSLTYFSENFGPYAHNQARIIEFPRYATFAQAFPGTMPYSEGIGFIARIVDEDDIDMVFYVTAHEMAHQWWAHQVIGSWMEGATLLSETLSQYAAIMVMEKEYGRDQIFKFLRYEMDAYLRSRGSEALKEKPLHRVDASQGYVHYRKGAVVLYYLKEMIGEEALNAALREVVEEHGYSGPPYPTSYALVDRLREATPDSLQYLITDLFEEITLFDNRVVGNPTYVELEDGRYEVTLEVSTTKLQADSLGAETEVPVNDFIDVGVLGEPEDGKERGRPLAMERHRLTTGTHTFTFVVDEMPWEAGIDPSYFLIDRIPDDNLKRVRAN
jgi:hypothetical protein